MENVLALVNGICPVCNDDRDYCPHAHGKHGTGDWRIGDALLELGEVLGKPPHTARHSRGRHGA